RRRVRRASFVRSGRYRPVGGSTLVRRAQRLAAAIWVAALVALSASGCNAILGITDDPVVSTPSGRACLLKSDCRENEICLFTVCSPPCAANRDCDQAHGERCLKVAEGTACVSDDATT